MGITVPHDPPISYSGQWTVNRGLFHRG